MEAEIITIGDELLIGQTTDTNSVYLGKKLGEIGISIIRKTAIRDKESAILGAVAESLSRVNLVLVTGGLGPTKDDITKKTLCTYYQCGYRRDEAVLEHLRQIFESRGRLMLETNQVQADLPEACETLHNAVGTAPGMWFERDQKILISMPGVPSEVYHLVEERVIPRLKQRFPLPNIEHRTLVTLQKAESLLSKQLESFESQLPKDLSLAYLPSFNMVKLRLSQTITQSKESNVALIDEYFQRLQETISDDVFCLGDIDPALYLSNYFIEKNITFTTAESCTGGWVAHRLMQAPGISSVYPGSMVAYANEQKIDALGVPLALIQENGAVSEACALAMAEGARHKYGVDLAIATTGIAGPGGGTKEKPVGLVYIAVSTKSVQLCKPFRLFGNREQIIQRSSNAALWLVKRALNLPTHVGA